MYGATIKKIRFGSVLAFAACAVSVWLHILTLGVCVCLLHRSKLY
jgi:hypothetical protein